VINTGDGLLLVSSTGIEAITNEGLQNISDKKIKTFLLDEMTFDSVRGTYDFVRNKARWLIDGPTYTKELVLDLVTGAFEVHDFVLGTNSLLGYISQVLRSARTCTCTRPAAGLCTRGNSGTMILTRVRSVSRISVVRTET
jgi:hypothetical protein